jgi:hypothetical protein
MTVWLNNRRQNFSLVFLHVISFCNRQRVATLINPAYDIDKSGGRRDTTGKEDWSSRHVSAPNPFGRLKVINVYTLHLTLLRLVKSTHEN